MDCNDITVLFGSSTTDRVFNLMLLKAKHFIYVKRLEEFEPVFNSFKMVMKSYYHLEKYNAVKMEMCQDLTKIEMHISFCFKHYTGIN